jgi:predicted amidophosphoribosyltransferase
MYPPQVCQACLGLMFTQHGAMCPQCRAPLPRNTPVNWTLKSICVSAAQNGSHGGY